MDPVWLKHYQAGVPATINPDEYSSLNDLFAQAFKKYSNLPACTNMGVTLTYAELDQAAEHFAAYLQQNFKILPGERFAIMMPNLLQYPIALLGILRTGAVVVNVNPLYTADELEHQLRDAQVSGIIVLENFAHTVAEVHAKLPIKNIVITKISDLLPVAKALPVDFIVKYVKHLVPEFHIKDFTWYKQLMHDGARVKLTPVPVTGKDIAFLQYTGGTTGVAKGAILTHRNMVANVLQASSWLVATLQPGKEIIITALPLYHIFSLTANCLTFIHYGALNVFVTNPRDKKQFVKILRKYRFTALTGVNTLFNLLLNSPGIEKVNFSALKIALGGGMSVQRIVADKWQELTHRPLLEAYGLTETSPAVCINPMNLTSFNGTVGLPVSSTEISVRDDNDRELGFDQEGELWVRGPQVTSGYWQQPEETKKVLTADGWLRTGDIVKVSAEGFVKIVDRKKDMIIVSGFNVYPNEVEDVIARMPGVAEVAVIGVQDPTHGEIVKAFVVKKNPALSEASVINYCHQHLTGYKIPKEVEFRDSLPKSNVGKILRRALRD